MTKRTLALSLRPRKFSQMIGQDELALSIQAQYKSGREPAAWMFTGPTGSGKTSIARILALSLQCKHGKIGEPCDDCWKMRSAFQSREVNASEISGVEEVGQLMEGSVYLPRSPSRRNIYTLDEAHRMSTAAQNLALKYFEDAPQTTVWMICTTEAHKILETLRSRCITAELKPLQADDIEKLVKRALKAVSSDKTAKPLVDELCEVGVQYPRLILNAVEKYLAGVKVQEAVKNLISAVDSKAICRAMEKGDWNTIKEQTSKASADDLRGIRAQVAGYLRGMLESKTPGPRAKEVAKAIEMLARVDSFTDITQGPATVGCLYELSQLFGGPVEEVDD